MINDVGLGSERCEDKTSPMYGKTESVFIVSTEYCDKVLPTGMYACVVCLALVHLMSRIIPHSLLESCIIQSDPFICLFIYSFDPHFPLTNSSRQSTQSNPSLPTFYRNSPYNPLSFPLPFPGIDVLHKNSSEFLNIIGPYLPFSLIENVTLLPLDYNMTLLPLTFGSIYYFLPLFYRYLNPPLIPSFHHNRSLTLSFSTLPYPTLLYPTLLCLFLRIHQQLD